MQYVHHFICKNLVKYAYLKGAWTSDSHIVIAGLSNSYSHYITTFEEYQEQRYEGGSTLYGPHTLAAYQQIFDDLATKLARNQSVPSGPIPFDRRGRTISFMPPPIWDGMLIFNCLCNSFSFFSIPKVCQPENNLAMSSLMSTLHINPAIQLIVHGGVRIHEMIFLLKNPIYMLINSLIKHGYQFLLMMI